MVVVEAREAREARVVCVSGGGGGTGVCVSGGGVSGGGGGAGLLVCTPYTFWALVMQVVWVWSCLSIGSHDWILEG